MRRIIMILGITLISLIGINCQNGGCIKVGGAYQDYQGDVQYCFNSAKTKASGVPSFDMSKDTISKTPEKTIYGFSLAKVKEILRKLKEKLGVKSESATIKIKKHPVKELMEILDIRE